MFLIKSNYLQRVKTITIFSLAHHNSVNEVWLSCVHVTFFLVSHTRFIPNSIGRQLRVVLYIISNVIDLR